MGFNCVNCFIVRHIGARFTMEIYGLMLGFGTFDTYNSRSEGTSKNHIFTNVSHVLDHNNVYLNDTLK